MKETIYVSGKREFKITINSNGGLKIIDIDGKTRKFRYKKIENNIFLIVQEDGKKHTVYIAKDKNRFYAWLKGVGYILEEKGEEYSASGAVKKEEGVQYVSSPMPGKVVKVLVKPGDKVREGQGLIIVESMKMENEFTADFDGVVKEVKASPGDQIDADVPLVIIESLAKGGKS